MGCAGKGIDRDFQILEDSRDVAWLTSTLLHSVFLLSRRFQGQTSDLVVRQEHRSSART